MTEQRPRVVMVSGANRGIGRAIADQLTTAGYILSLGVRREEEIARLEPAFDSDRTVIHSYEARDRESPAQWVASTIGRFGRLDGLVNAAGILLDFSFLDDAEDRFDELIDINVKGPMRLMREAYPHLKASGAGRIVNIASLSGLRVPSPSAGYAMSKFAVVALTHAARHIGWRDGVRATAVCPGFVNTDMVAEVDVVPKDEMIPPEAVATIVQMVIEMPNNASISHVPVNCSVEPVY